MSTTGFIEVQEARNEKLIDLGRQLKEQEERHRLDPRNSNAVTSVNNFVKRGLGKVGAWWRRHRTTIKDVLQWVAGFSLAAGLVTLSFLSGVGSFYCWIMFWVTLIGAGTFAPMWIVAAVGFGLLYACSKAVIRAWTDDF